MGLKPLGLIAGNRSLPFLLAREVRQQGERKLIVIAFEGETNPELAELVDEICWVKVGQLGKLINAFKTRGVTECVMAGQIAPRNLFDLRPDARAIKLLFGLKEKNAHTIFGGIADELKKDGIELIPATPWLAPHIPASGFLLGPRLSPSQDSDVRFGLGIAKQIARLEIGQSVVVKEGTVLAVEGFEGTDACLRRGGDLAGKKGGAVAVKVAKLNHDFRFDIPCIGPQTLETCAAAGIAVLAIEAGKTLVLEKSAVDELLKKSKITLLAVS